jgi:hypothetical protein
MDVEMNICKTCKYWKKLENSYMNDIGICNLIPQYDDIWSWDIENQNLILKTEYVNKLAFVRDASNIHADFLTRENFGCVQHE